MKIASVVIGLWIFAIVISMFYATTSGTEGLYNGTETLSTENESDAALDLLLHPDEFSTSSLFYSMIALLSLGGIIAVGLGAIMKSDMVLLGGLVSVLVGLVTYPMTRIYQFFVDGFSQIMCTNIGLDVAADACTPALMATTVVVGVIAFMYVMAVIEWWTARRLT